MSSLSPCTLSCCLLISFFNQSVAWALREEGQREELNQRRDSCESQEDWPSWTEHKWRPETRICSGNLQRHRHFSSSTLSPPPNQVISEGGGHLVLAKMSLLTKNIGVKNRGKDLVGKNTCMRASLTRKDLPKKLFVHAVTPGGRVGEGRGSRSKELAHWLASLGKLISASSLISRSQQPCPGQGPLYPQAD